MSLPHFSTFLFTFVHLLLLWMSISICAYDMPYLNQTAAYFSVYDGKDTEDKHSAFCMCSPSRARQAC